MVWFLMFVGKIRFQFIAKVIGMALIGVFIIYASAKWTPLGTSVMPRSATWVSRVDNFVIAGGDEQQMDKDYQQTQALVAIQNGGIIWGWSRKKYAKEYIALFIL